MATLHTTKSQVSEHAGDAEATRRGIIDAALRRSLGQYGL